MLLTSIFFASLAAAIHVNTFAFDFPCREPPSNRAAFGTSADAKAKPNTPAV
ncbi:hypothetical protein E9229_003313 [Paeniglutamicibacter cryotolerans]|uniref:Uncharacterized protein n=1 Tax=Paeniglutamicibacter cryotolerans TaxID=670079 RepID=A0A839QSX4_9MICC|nr:hypothetical protein [Paeniglutamicibacter cryotolerans]